MKSWFLAAVCLMFAFHAMAAQAWRFEGRGVEAYASFNQSSGCVSNSAEIAIGKFRIVDGQGKAGGTVESIIYVDSFNLCTNKPLVSAFGFPNFTSSEFRINPSLKFAALNASVTLFDANSNQSIPVVLQLTWAGAKGEKTRNAFRSHAINPGITTKFTDLGVSNPAIVKGSITIGLGNLFLHPLIPEVL
jgi:hypothetical protein